MSSASKRGGTGSARTDEHGGSERRRRQLSCEVVGARIRMDSSEDIWAGRTKRKVRFGEGGLMDRFDGGRFEGESFEGQGFYVAGVEEIAGCTCCTYTCLVCVATVPSTVIAWYISNGNDDALTTNNHNHNTLIGNIHNSDIKSGQMTTPNTPTKPIDSPNVQTRFEVPLVSTLALMYLRRRRSTSRRRR